MNSADLSMYVLNITETLSPFSISIWILFYGGDREKHGQNVGGSNVSRAELY